MASQQADRTRTIIVRLNIDSEELLKLYRGSARDVSASPLKATHHGLDLLSGVLISIKRLFYKNFIRQHDVYLQALVTFAIIRALCQSEQTLWWPQRVPSQR